MGESIGEKSKQTNLFSRELEKEEDRKIEDGFMLGISCENCGARFIEQFQNGIIVPSIEGEPLLVYVYDYEHKAAGKHLGTVHCPHCGIEGALQVFWRLPISFEQEWEGEGQGKFAITEAGDESIH
jgi:hypothetical protein